MLPISLFFPIYSGFRYNIIIIIIMAWFTDWSCSARLGGASSNLSMNQSKHLASHLSWMSLVIVEIWQTEPA
jgi:hypothetical protein